MAQSASLPMEIPKKGTLSKDFVSKHSLLHCFPRPGTSHSAQRLTFSTGRRRLSKSSELIWYSSEMYSYHGSILKGLQLPKSTSTSRRFQHTQCFIPCSPLLTEDGERMSRVLKIMTHLFSERLFAGHTE